MRTAMGQPIQDVSEVVLQKLASKNINSGLGKYKVNLGPTAGGLRGLPVKVPGRRDRTRSPNRIIGSPTRLEDAYGGIDHSEFSKEVSSLLSDLHDGSSTKMSLMKVLIVKCDNNVSTYKRLRGSIESGDFQEVDRLLGELEESNHASLNDL